MTEVDTSSYLKPAALPAQKSILDQVQQFQQIDSSKNVIDKQKLDLVNQRFSELSKGFSTLIGDKNLDRNKVVDYINNQVKLGYIPQEMANATIQQLPEGGEALKNKLKQDLTHAQTTVDAINTVHGTPVDIQDNQNIYSGTRASPMNGGGITPATATPIQLPPTQSGIDNNRMLPNGEPNPNFGAAGPIGAMGPPGPRSVAAPALPVQQPSLPPSQPAPLPAARMAPQGTLSSPSIPGQSSNFGGNVVGAIADAPTDPATTSQRINAAYPQRITTALPPGVAEANKSVAEQSGKDYATDLSRARNFKQDLYPAVTALKGIEELGTQNVGPGTPQLNDIKSAIITWLPNADKAEIEKVGTFQQTRKYLSQIARTSGNTGTNDQLAAAFEANPSITMSKAATENVLKSVIALRKMQHAQVLLAEKENVPPEQYSKWIAKNQNTLDARAFGFDLMNNDAKQKLVTELKKDPKALKKFENSLQFAHDADLIEPPARK